MDQAPEEFTVADALARTRKLMRFHPAAAARQASAIIEVEPTLAEGHFLLSYALRHLGRIEDSEAVEKEAIRRAVNDPVAVRARSLIEMGRDEEAEALLKRAIEDTPNDPEITRLLAKIALRAGRVAQAEYSLRNSLRAAPRFEAARKDLDELVAAHGSLSKGVREESGEQQFALALRMNEEQLERTPDDPWIWMSYGHVLRIAGRAEEALQAYRKSVALAPEFGEAWWAIADLKTASFTDEDRASMEAALLRQEQLKQRASIHFALGRAYQDIDDPERSFHHYNTGNELRALETPFDSDRLDRIVGNMIATFTPEFVEARQGCGASESDPIFIVSLPRSGSTLLEQMLASHSQIEATDELLELEQLANGLAGNLGEVEEVPDYMDRLAKYAPDRLRSLGKTYLVNTLAERHQAKTHYLDKATQNWLHVGLIHLILPNAKIIDIRRNPMACGFSNFTQNYAFGRGFSYDLRKFGRYYRKYVQLMDHFDKVLPNRIHHLRYEDIVRNPEAELRKIFEYLELPFEEQTLRFHESKRAVKTSSSEQVRKPVNEKGIKAWEPFEPWLKPLVEALGDAPDGSVS